MTTADAAHDMALAMIRGMVECGHYTDEQIVQYRGGNAGPNGWIDIGGMRCSIHNKMHTGNIVHVSRVGTEDCCHVFTVESLIREVREPEPTRQMALFG